MGPHQTYLEDDTCEKIFTTSCVPRRLLECLYLKHVLGRVTSEYQFVQNFLVGSGSLVN